MPRPAIPRIHTRPKAGSRGVGAAAAQGHDIGGASRRQSLLRWLSFQGL
jgi:hypothetical protein